MFVYVNVCCRGTGAYLYCSKPLQCRHQENGKTLFQTSYTHFHVFCLKTQKNPAVNMLLNQRAADVLLSVDNLAVCEADGLRRFK